MNKYLIFTLLFVFSNSVIAQKNFLDQAYLETSASADSLVVPDKIYLSIHLNEADSKNKITIEAQEKQLEATLKALGIDTEKDLSLLDLSSDFKKYFIKGQNILKSKLYSLLVGDAVLAGQVIIALEAAGISNVNLDRFEYSRAEQLLLDLKTKAMVKSKITAESLANALNQKIGKAVYISDIATASNTLQGQAAGYQIRGYSSLYGARAPEPIYTEFQKLKFEVHVNVNYLLE